MINYSTLELEYKDSKGETRPYYLLSKDMFTLLMFNYEGYIEFKIKFIDKFNEMERELKQLQAGEIQAEDIKSTDKETSPYKEVIKRYANYTVTNIADEIGVEPHELNHFLCRKGIQYKDGERYFLTDWYSSELVKDVFYRDEYGNGRTFMVWTKAGKDFILDFIEECQRVKDAEMAEDNK
ncbi:Rha family transcriptional regulator [Staphylococcus pseudintermedius]|nr:Rha family transcriptional regulator [Staphylococcus pseudintermedius]